MKARDTANPDNRFRSVSVRYDEGDGPPPAAVHVLEDHSRSILSRNDSPDLDFRWSCNPYRGCLHACAYCVSGDTRVLMGDGRTKLMRELAVGDEIYGTRVEGTNRYYTRTKVLAHWTTTKVAYSVVLSDGTELVASGDHRFLSERGWKYVMPFIEHGQRPHLTLNNSLVGTGAFARAPDDTPDYRRGYLCGLIRGDGMLWTGTRRGSAVHQFRLALTDLEALARARRYLADDRIEIREYVHQAARVGYREVRAIRASSRFAYERIVDVVDFTDEPSDDWCKGFLAGVFDAEGSHHAQALRITNCDPELIVRIMLALERFGFDATVEPPRPGVNRPVRAVRIRGGFRERLRFFHLTGPAISRKWDFEGQAIKTHRSLRVVSIVRLGVQQLYDITTGTGDFIANGVVSHNCYARPSHEYLDLGAGTDFDTKIVIKPKAAELLRDAFDKPSWQGEMIMFSGVTDCYQAIERELTLTRQCLEVCLEYRNPVALISKSALIERDVDLLAELAREAGCHVSVSLAWTDAELARTIEPWAASPERRLKVIETMAKAGVPVGVMIAPVIPGLNDKQLIPVLEAARAAGATSAGWALLRLPGAVKQVFEERVRAALPLAADKILSRIRDTRGGGEKLYDPRFHIRGRGEGAYAQTIATVFDATVARLGFNARSDERDLPSRFQRPPKKTAQLSLF